MLAGWGIYVLGSCVVRRIVGNVHHVFPPIPLLTQTHILETGIIYVSQRFEAAVVAAVIFVCGIAKK